MASMDGEVPTQGGDVADSQISPDYISGARCMELSKSYDKYVYGSWKTAHTHMIRDLASGSSTKLMRRHARALLTGFRRKRRLLDKYTTVDHSSFPWARDMVALTARDRKKLPVAFAVGELVEAAEVGVPGELCTVRELYPGECCVVESSKGPKLCHLRLMRKANPSLSASSGITGESNGTSDTNASSDAVADDNTSSNNDGTHEQAFAVDELVEVMRRAWIGINKPGGVGKILRFHEDTGMYDVSYVLGGRERNIEAKYISRVAFLERTVKRDTLGRCRRPDCPCFIKDCGHVQPGEEIDRIVERIHLAKEKRRAIKAASDAEAGLVDATGLMTQSDEQLQLMTDVSTTNYTPAKNADPPRQRLRKMKPKSLTTRLIERAGKDETVLLPPSLLQRMKRTYNKDKSGGGDFVSAMVSLSEGHADHSRTSSGIARAAASGLREVNGIVTSTSSSSGGDGLGTVRGRGFGVLDSLATVGSAATATGVATGVVVIGGARGGSLSNNTITKSLSIKDTATFKDANNMSARTDVKSVKETFDRNVKEIEESCRMEIMDPDFVTKLSSSSSNRLGHVKFINSFSAHELLDVLISVNSRIYSKGDETKSLRAEIKKSIQILDENGSSTQEEASFASSIRAIESKIELLRLTIERSSLDVFDAAYKRQGKHKNILTDAQRKERKMLELSYRNLRESWRVDEQELVSLLKQLRSKYRSVFGAEVIDIRSPPSKGNYTSVYGSYYGPGTSTTSTNTTPNNPTSTAITAPSSLEAELGGRVDDEGEAFAEVRVPSKRRRIDIDNGIDNDGISNKGTKGDRGNEFNRALSQYSKQPRNKSNRSESRRGGGGRSNTYTSKQRASKDDFDFICNDYDGLASDGEIGEGDFWMDQYLQYQSSSSSSDNEDEGTSNNWGMNRSKYGDRYDGDSDDDEWRQNRQKKKLPADIRTGKSSISISSSTYGTTAVLSQDEDLESNSQGVNREVLLDDIASALFKNTSTPSWPDIATKLKDYAKLFFDTEKHLVGSGTSNINTLDGSIALLSARQSSCVLAIVTSGSLETSSAAELNLVAWKEIVDTLFMRVLSSIDIESISREQFQSEFYSEISALFAIILSKERTSVNKDVIASFDSLLAHIITSWHEFDCFAADRLESKFQLGDYDATTNNATITGILLKIISMHFLKLQMLSFMCEGSNESIFGPSGGHMKASLSDIWNFLMWIVSHHAELALSALKFMLELCSNSTKPIEIDSNINTSGAAIACLWAKTVDIMSRTGHNLASKTAFWTYPLKLGLTWLRKQRLDLDCTAPWMCPNSDEAGAFTALQTLSGVNMEVPWELLRHGGASAIKLKPQLAGAVQVSLTLWSILYLHTTASRLAMISAGESASARTPNCWSLVKFIYAALMAQRRSEKRSLQAIRFMLRISCLAAVWDAPADGFDILIDACADISTGLKWIYTTAGDTNARQQNTTTEGIATMMSALLSSPNVGASSTNTDALAAVIDAGLSVLGYKSMASSSGPLTSTTSAINDNASAPKTLEEFALRACDFVDSFVSGATSNATVIAVKRFRSKLLTSEGLLSIGSRNPLCDPIFTRLFNVVVVSRCSDIFEDSLRLDVDLNRQLIQSLNAYSIYAYTTSGSTSTASSHNITSRSSELDRKLWSAMMEHLLPAVAVTAVFQPWCTYITRALLASCSSSSSISSTSASSITGSVPLGYDSWSIFLPWLFNYSSAVMQRLKDETKAASIISQLSQYHCGVLLTAIPSTISYVLFCPGTAEELSLIRNIVAILAIILSSSTTTGIDVVMGAVKTASVLVKVCKNASKSGSGTNILKAISMDVIGLSTGLKSCIIYYLPLVQDTSSLLSLDSSQPWIICTQASTSLASICTFAASLELGPMNTTVNRAPTTSTSTTSSITSSILSKVASGRFAGVDESLLKLSGCEDSVSNSWLRHHFWSYVLVEVVRNKTPAYMSLFLENNYAILSVYVSTILSASCVPKLDFEIELFESNIIQCTRICSELISAKKLIVTESLRKGLFILNAISDYSSDIKRLSSYPLPGQHSSTSSWSDGLSRWSLLAVSVSTRALELQQRNDINGLQTVRKETTAFVTAVERCILFFRSKSTNASSAVRNDLLSRIYSLAATTALCLCPALGPTSMASIFTICYEPVISALVRYIEVSKASRQRNKTFRGFDESVPEIVQFSVTSLPAVVAYVSCTPFATRFLEWDALLQLLLLTHDCDNASLKEAVRRGWTRGLIGKPSLLLQGIGNGPHIESIAGRFMNGPFESFFAGKIAAFRRFIFENADVWAKFASKLKSFDPRLLQAVRRSLIRETYQSCMSILVDNVVPIDPKFSAFVIRNGALAKASLSVTSELHRLELAREAPVIALSAVTALLRALRLCLGHEIDIVDAVYPYYEDGRHNIGKLVKSGVECCKVLRYLIGNIEEDPCLRDWCKLVDKCVHFILSLLEQRPIDVKSESSGIFFLGFVFVASLKTANDRAAEAGSVFVSTPLDMIEEMKHHLEEICHRPNTILLLPSSSSSSSSSSSVVGSTDEMLLAKMMLNDYKLLYAKDT